MSSTRSFRGIRVVQFAGFELDVRAGELRQGERKVPLQDQPRRILCMLLDHPGEVVLREEICKRLWPNGTVVEVSHGINAAVLRLRDALGDSADNPRFVETVARRGYRFLAPVEVECRPAPSLRRPSSPAALDTEALAGQSLSHFRIEEMLGRGGMGVVYRAEDLSLGRMVALKFLPADMAGDPAAVSRFQREARLASALNHPNICTVYAVEECAGQPVIVMELLEGRTLEAILTAGPLPAPTALPLAIQMAAALDAAHRRQIVHRDLKPGNIMVTALSPSPASLKVLDFGLAKQSLTGSARPMPEVTQAGSLAGTPTYMAPERFQGQEADARSDIYSFGLVLLEMLTGCRSACDLRRLPPSAADLQPVLRRALEANPEERWQTARDLKAALELVAAVPAAPLPAAPPLAPKPAPELLPFDPPPARRVPLDAWKVAAAALLLAVAYVTANGWKERRPPAEHAVANPQTALPTAAAVLRPPEEAPVRLPATLRPPQPISSTANTIHWTGGPTQAGKMSLSPDGRKLAYAKDGQIFIRSIDSETPRLIAADSPPAGTPFWSPDGRSLAFTRSGKLFTVSAEGGPARAIGDSHTALAGAWGPDGTILIGVIGDGLVAIPASGGPARPITTPDAARGETRHLLPQFLPGGRKFLYTAGSNKAGEGTLYLASLDSPGSQAILHIDSGATFVPVSGTKGYLLYVRARYLMAQAFDPATLRLGVEPFPIAGPIATNVASAATATSIPDFSATPNTLVYRSAGAAPMGVMSVSLPGDKVLQRPARPIGLTIVKNWLPPRPR